MINQNVINGIRGYSKIIGNRSAVFLLYEDVLNRLDLIKHDHSNQIAVMAVDGKNQYNNGYQPAVDPSKAGIIYMAITQLVNSDFTITNYLPPNPLSSDGYIPVELAIELARQCGNRPFEMQIIQQIIPALDGSNAINSAMALRSQIESRQPVQQYLPFRPTPDNPFQGDVNYINNAYRIYYRYKDVIKYVIDLDQFMIYESTKDTYGYLTGGGIWRIANEAQFEWMLDRLEAELKQVARNDKEREVAQAFGNVTYTDKAINKIKGIPECRISSFDLNSYPYLLNVLNGVVDLRTGNLMPADPSLYLTQQAPVIYKPSARSPIFEQFITSVLPDPDTREAVLRYLGYCLTGDTSAQKALFIVGNGANGKTTLLNLMTRLLGSDYADSVSINLFNDKVIRSKSETTPERAKIMGRRFIQVDEIKAGLVLDANEFKLLTGSDDIPFRDMYKRSATMVNPTHKFIFSGNFLPSLGEEMDGGLIRRLKIAEFPRRFGPNDIDPDLSRKLTTPESLSGILNILIAQAIQYYKYGLGEESAAMEIIREEYISDLIKTVQSILNTKYIQSSNSYVLVSDLEEQVNQVISPNRLKQGQLKRIMSKLKYEPIKLKSGNDRDKRVYFGLKRK